jgi:hypothetical protein
MDSDLERHFQNSKIRRRSAMVKLKTEQNNFYTSVRYRKKSQRGYLRILSIPCAIFKRKFKSPFTAICQNSFSITFYVKQFINSVLHRLQRYSKTSTIEMCSSDLCCDSHVWANKMEMIRRLSDESDEE